jgi:hypothetical protein
MLTCLLVEVAELAVAVWVLGALQRLAGALQRIALLLEQPAHGVVADWVALRGQRLGELAGRLGRPAQRATGIAAGVGVDQSLQRLDQSRVGVGQALGAAAGPPDATMRVGGRVQLAYACVHRGARHPADAGHPGAAPAAQRPRPRSKQQAALLFGQVRGNLREQLGQHRVHVHAVNLPTPLDPRSTTGQGSQAGNP